MSKFDKVRCEQCDLHMPLFSNSAFNYCQECIVDGFGSYGRGPLLPVACSLCGEDDSVLYICNCDVICKTCKNRIKWGKPPKTRHELSPVRKCNL